MELPADIAVLRAGPATAGRFWPLLRHSLNAHGLLLAVALAYAAGFALLHVLMPGVGGKDGGEILLGILFFSLPAVVFGLTAYMFAEMAARDRPQRPIATLWRKTSGILTDRERLAAGLPAVAALVVFMYVFTMLKAYVPAIQPFAWDQTFERWDRALHFGVAPWELLQPVFGYWPVTFLVNLNYNMWFVVMNVFWAYFAFVRRPGEERTRFFLAYVLTWIVGGGVLAIAFSSAGPCYFGRLGLSPDPYAPLMDYLRAADQHATIWALGTQDMLWRLHSEGSAFGGVSAMPSMHNATALLFVLASRGWPRRVRQALAAHCALIFLGSVHLGWHYAVDGYIARALAAALWWLSGPVARWWEQTAPARAYRLAAAGPA